MALHRHPAHPVIVAAVVVVAVLRQLLHPVIRPVIPTVQNIKNPNERRTVINQKRKKRLRRNEKHVVIHRLHQVLIESYLDCLTLIQRENMYRRNDHQRVFKTISETPKPPNKCQKYQINEQSQKN